MKMVKCLICNKELVQITHTHLRKHGLGGPDEYRKAFPGALTKANVEVMHYSEYCGREFFAYLSLGRRYCSRNCSDRDGTGSKNHNYKDYLVLQCKQCDKSFQVKPYDAKEGNRKFCSLKCAYKYPERAELMRKLSVGKYDERNGNWKGGSSYVPYPFTFDMELKELIRKRDGYICQLCLKHQSKNGKRLAIHHIDYNKENCDPKNLISLCNYCNGKVNGNREHWKYHFQKIVAFIGNDNCKTNYIGETPEKDNTEGSCVSNPVETARWIPSNRNMIQSDLVSNNQSSVETAEPQLIKLA